MRHYARNIGDLAAATRGLDLLHRGAYDALLDAYYLTERPLPADTRECYLLADARSPAERRAVDAVLARFFHLEADGYHQKRCDAELKRWSVKSQGSRDAINLRWERERQARASIEQQKQDEQDTNVIRTYAEPDTNVIPPTNHEPRTTTSLPTVGKKTKAAVAPLALPGWLPADAWEAWKRHRGRKLTADAIGMQIAKLGTLRQKGHDPAQVIGQSIERGWSGLFPLKPDDAPRTAKHDRRDQVAGEIWTGVPNAKRPDENAIDGTAERVA